MIGYQQLRVDRRGAVAIIRHDHPPRNFLTARGLSELRRCFQALERDHSVRVIVLTGARDGHFMLHTETAEISAMMAQVPPLPGPALRLVIALAQAAAWLLGRWPRLADLVLAARSERALVRNALLEMMVLSRTIERSSKVTIAAINGTCIGGGLELSLCFDQRVMMDDPDFRIGLPEVLIGLLPGFGGSQRLTRLIGADRTLGLLLAGELMTPTAAAAAGLVSRAIEPASFWPEAFALADRLARRPPLAAQAIKRAVRRGGSLSLHRGLALELREVARLSRSHDTRAGLRDYSAEIATELRLPESAQRSFHQLTAVMDRGELTTFEGR